MLNYKQDFLNSLLSNNYSDKTIFSYKRDLDAFETYLEINHIPFDNITRRVVDDFKGILRKEAHHKLFRGSALPVPAASEASKDTQDKGLEGGSRKKTPQMPLQTKHLTVSNSKTGLASRSINRMLSSLRKYLRYLVINDLECPLPPDKVEFVKREKNITPLADFADLIKLIEAPEVFEKVDFVKKRNRAFLEMLFSTGMRISEATSLDLDQLGHSDKATSEFVLNERIFVTGKGKKQRFIYLTPRCQFYLMQYIRMRTDKLPALFIPTKGTRLQDSEPRNIRIANNYFQYKIVQYRKLLGINVRTSAHSLRHGFATFMAEKGANVVALQTLLGHESLATTTKYIHSSDKLAQQTHKDFHPLNMI
jgi:integrase/recombinase XerC